MFRKTTDSSPKAATKRHIERLAKNARAKETEGGMIPLGTGFVPGPRDVICARGKLGGPNHTGNCRYQVVLEMHLRKYSTAKTRVEKSSIVSSIVELIREGSPNGGFVKQDQKGQWYEVGNYLARQKVGKKYGMGFSF